MDWTSLFGGGSGGLSTSSSSNGQSQSGRAGTGFKIDTGGVDVSTGGMGAAGFIGIGLLILIGIVLLFRRS